MRHRWAARRKTRTPRRRGSGGRRSRCRRRSPRLFLLLIDTLFGAFGIHPRSCRPAPEALASGGYPYDKPIKDKLYEEELEQLQIELVKMQRHVGDAALRLVMVFEGRDAAARTARSPRSDNM